MPGETRTLEAGNGAASGAFSFDALSILALILRFFGCDRPPASDGGTPACLVYYDCEPQLVERQREFRRLRKTERDRSNASLASLDTVVDFLQRRIEFKFGHSSHRGTVDNFDEAYHHVAFDDGTQYWFGLNNQDSGHAQQMLPDDDGAFSTNGPSREFRLI